MGRPYQSELAQIPTTFDWALKQDISGLRDTLLYKLGPYNLVAIGSGGSLVAAEFAALFHETVTGHLARSATPLEATVRQTPQNTAALLLSASGSNADILQAGRLLPQLGYETMAALCTRRESRLSAIVSDLGGMVHEFPIPSGRDGFLATNSLIATLVLLHRAAAALPIPNELDGELTLSDVMLKGTETALDNRTLIVLGQGWAAPAALDLETRFSEAALANVSVTDPRNFAHGRHNWLAMHGEDTGIVSLETQSSEAEATKTLKFLPEDIEVLRVKSERNGPAATIDLVAAAMKLAATAAETRGIDPGRPTVSNFGRRLFHAGAFRHRGPHEAASISKKRRALSLSPNGSLAEINAALHEFVQRLKTTAFTSLAIDYDGTLCARNQRFEPLTEHVRSELNRLLADDIPVGVASGRGRSLHRQLRGALDPKYWDRVIVALYNGAKVVKLSDDILDSEEPVPDALAVADSRLRSLGSLLGLETVVRPHQISIRAPGSIQPLDLRAIVVEHLAGIGEVSVLASSHSVDIVLKSTSKTAVVNALHRERLGCTLRIGDQGAAGGNDFEFLNTGLSLSVDRVSSNLATCWNLGPPGASGPSLTLQYLAALTGRGGYLYVDTSRPPFRTNG